MAACNSIVAILILAFCGCRAAPEKPAPLTDQEREAKVDRILAPVVEGLAACLEARSAGLTPFMKEGSDFEPRVSDYLAPRLLDGLVKAGAHVMEREDLDRVVKELSLQMTDLFDEDTQVELGRLSGVEILILGTVQDLTATIYRVKVKAVEVETGRMLWTQSFDLQRELLPVRYGGL